MAKNATDKDTPATVRLTKDGLNVETTLASDVVEMKSQGFTVVDGEGKQAASAASGSDTGKAASSSSPSGTSSR